MKILYKYALQLSLLCTINISLIHTQESLLKKWYTDSKKKMSVLSSHIKDTVQEKQALLKKKLIPTYHHFTAVMHDATKNISQNAYKKALESQQRLLAMSTKINSNVKNYIHLSKNYIINQIKPVYHTMPSSTNIIEKITNAGLTAKKNTLIIKNSIQATCVPLCKKCNAHLYHACKAISNTTLNKAHTIHSYAKKGIAHAASEVKNIQLTNKLKYGTHYIINKSRALKTSIQHSEYTETMMGGMQEYGPSIFIAGVGLFFLQDLLAPLSK